MDNGHEEAVELRGRRVPGILRDQSQQSLSAPPRCCCNDLEALLHSTSVALGFPCTPPNVHGNSPPTTWRADFNRAKALLMGSLSLKLSIDTFLGGSVLGPLSAANSRER